VAPVLAARKIRSLWTHQARALDLVEQGADVVLATPTASGKTLVYNLPALLAAARDPGARALYLFPLKALEQDQRARLEADAAALPGDRPRVAIYDGDTSAHQRKKLRDDPPHVLITTPDMLHVGILPHHAAWRGFFRALRLVVVDELHAYRGIFGSHVAQVLRRALRVAAFHGAAPRIVAASATIANPGELAHGLTGRPFAVVRENGAPLPRRHVLLLRPEASPYTLAARLFRLAVGMGLRTIAFTKARRTTELLHAWVVEAEPRLAGRISSYRAGFLAEERREIERRLFSGELLGVISTSALEMGIDVGQLDVCILVGYPGSQIATWQRAGRVGRSREAAIALVAQPDALDQYLVSHPKVFFERGFEHAVVDPGNEEVLAAHLPCAAAEVPLRAGEPWLADPAVARAAAALEARGRLLRSESGGEWFASRRLPHRDVSLRAAGESFSIALDGEPGRRAVIGTIGSGRVQAECHEGAIYLHRARQYLVTRLALDEREVSVRAVDVAHYTQALSEKATEILERGRTRPAGSFRLVLGRVRVTTRITGFERRRIHGQELLGSEPLELPPTSFETASLWLEIPDEVPAAVAEGGGHPMGGLHATEHAALSLFPLFALCDRHDVAGISSVRHAQTGHPAIFFYDSHPGGVGLVASLFERFETLLQTTLELVADCPCEDGCPGCVHSPKCGSGNRPIDKAAALRTLRLLLGHEPLPRLAPEPARATRAAPVAAPAPPPPAAAPRLVFFDLETQRSAEEVGGWHNAHLMRVALAVLFDAREERFASFGEGEVPALLERLAAADLVVGFNVRRFDYAVLRGYTDRDLERLPTFDLLDAVHARLGFRVSLGHLAGETLGREKSGDGLEAIRWWREGRLDELRRYCERDVALLRDLFHFGLEHGFLLFRTRAGERVRLPARWSLPEILEAARHAPPAPPRRRAGRTR
jgi:DEAD/DEAH box helicase domain-containing protein